MDGTLKIVGHISDFAGIIGAFISFIIWLKIRNQTKRMIELARQKNNADKGFAEMVEYHSIINSSNPHAFCLALTDRTPTLKAEVENFMREKKWKMPIEELNLSGLTHENFSDFIEEVKKRRRVFQAKGVTEVHLFISGPMQAAVMVGAIFDNWVPVKIYNMDPQSRKYEYWCHLSK
jgi:hypothetical protein